MTKQSWFICDDKIYICYDCNKSFSLSNKKQRSVILYRTFVIQLLLYICTSKTFNTYIFTCFLTRNIHREFFTYPHEYKNLLFPVLIRFLKMFDEQIKIIIRFVSKQVSNIYKLPTQHKFLALNTYQSFFRNKSETKIYMQQLICLKKDR